MSLLTGVRQKGNAKLRAATYSRPRKPTDMAPIKHQCLAAAATPCS